MVDTFCVLGIGAFSVFLLYKYYLSPANANRLYMEAYRDLRCPIFIVTYDEFDKEAEVQRRYYTDLLKEVGNTVLTEKDVHVFAYQGIVEGKSTLQMTRFEFTVYVAKQQLAICDKFQMRFYKDASSKAEAYDLRGQTVPSESTPKQPVQSNQAEWLFSKKSK